MAATAWTGHFEVGGRVTAAAEAWHSELGLADVRCTSEGPDPLFLDSIVLAAPEAQE